MHGGAIQCDRALPEYLQRIGMCAMSLPQLAHMTGYLVPMPCGAHLGVAENNT